MPMATSCDICATAAELAAHQQRATLFDPVPELQRPIRPVKYDASRPRHVFWIERCDAENTIERLTDVNFATRVQAEYALRRMMLTDAYCGSMHVGPNGVYYSNSDNHASRIYVASGSLAMWHE